MRKTILTVLLILGLSLILVGISLLVLPDWLNIPGGILILLGIAIAAIAALGSGLKNWREFLFPAPAKTKTDPQRSQKIASSPEAEQQMHGQAGVQKQGIVDSPGAKQHMD